MSETDYDAIMEAGRVALLPGYKLLMKRTIAFLESEFNALMGDLEQPAKKLGRPKRTPENLEQTAAKLEKTAIKAGKKNSKVSQQGKSYWAQFTPEERRAEMRRRSQVSKERRGMDRNELSRLAKAANKVNSDEQKAAAFFTEGVQ